MASALTQEAPMSAMSVLGAPNVADPYNFPYELNYGNSALDPKKKNNFTMKDWNLINFLSNRDTEQFLNQLPITVMDKIYKKNPKEEERDYDDLELSDEEKEERRAGAEIERNYIKQQYSGDLKIRKELKDLMEIIHSSGMYAI